MDERQYLRRALTLAKQRQGQTAPNPSVGCVIVKDQVIIAEGLHQAPGKAHAERAALETLSPQQSRGATLYVTLEPCCHVGRTPPCTEIIIEKHIAKVIYGVIDPNPLMAGAGIQRLEEVGIPCQQVELTDINYFYRSYAFWQRQQWPFTRLKLALSQDEKIAGKQGEPRAITGADSNHYSHQQRWQASAILSSANTIINDDPQLTARLDQKTCLKPLFIIDAHLQISETANIFTTGAPITLFCLEAATRSHNYQRLKPYANIIALAAHNQRLDLRAVLQTIGKQGYYELWLELGGRLSQAFVQQGLINEGLFYQSEHRLGEDAQPGPSLQTLLASATSIHHRQFTHDQLTTACYTVHHA